MKIYNKLVRDKIPEIIENEGKKVTTKILNDEEYRTELNRKLKEEVNEYLEENCVEELADIVEVIYGILNSMEVSKEEFESVRKSKAEKRGGFEKRIYLIESE